MKLQVEMTYCGNQTPLRDDDRSFTFEIDPMPGLTGLGHPHTKRIHARIVNVSAPPGDS